MATLFFPGPANLTVWSIQLDPMAAGGPYTITVSLLPEESQTIQITDVLFGDVWLCSGQSNMEFIVPEVRQCVNVQIDTKYSFANMAKQMHKIGV